MTEYGTEWVKHKEFTSIGRIIRDLPEDCPERATLHKELVNAHDTMTCDEFNAWASAFRARAEEAKRRIAQNSIK